MKTNSKNIIAAIAVFASLAAAAQAPRGSILVDKSYATDTTAMGVAVTGVELKRNADLMSVAMTINLENLKMKGDREIVYTPVIYNGEDSVFLNSIALFGRTRWIQAQRKGFPTSRKLFPAPTLMDSAEVTVDSISTWEYTPANPTFANFEINNFKYSERPDSVAYFESVPFQDWMNSADLALIRTDYGCCNHLQGADTVELARYDQVEFYPTLRYVKPIAAGSKRYELEGQSYIDFPVDQTIIYPEYRRNTIELDSIRRTIDIARNNPDATIDTIWLKGFASPESPYSHNRDLAIGRTAALKQYIQNYYNFSGVEMVTDYEPEDWEGLRKAVESSGLEHRDEILAIIDSDMEPDPKEWKIKSTYPQEYKFMLQTYYPALRHTNYKVSYTIKSFSDPVEILEVMRTRPGNLSLEEFNTAASVLEPGTPEFNEVFETAVRMFPDDETANLNAANAALAAGNLDAAERYLARAGNSPDAEYARRVLAAFRGDTSALEKLITK